VIHDLDIDAAVERLLERMENRLVREFIGGHTQRIASWGFVDVSQAGFEQAARQPDDLWVLGIIDVRWRLVAKLLGEFLAGDSTAVEPHPVRGLVIPFRFGADVEVDLVPRVTGKSAGFAVHR
jgi:hypothetical protein